MSADDDPTRALNLGSLAGNTERAQQLASRTEHVLVEQRGQPRYDTLRRQGDELGLDEVIALLAESVEDAP